MDFEKSSIEQLKRSLYSRNENIIPKEKRTPVQNHEESGVPVDWGQKPSFDINIDEMTVKKNSFFNKFFLIAFVFFLLSLGIAAFIFFGGINTISSNNVDIKIVAPSSVSSGEVLDIGLTMVNGNRTDLEGAVLYIDYPTGVKTADDKNTPVTRDKIDLGTIQSGKSKDYAVRALLFGEKDVVKTLTFTIEYKVKGSNAVFSKEKTYDVTIGSSPLLLNVTYPKEVNSGKQITISIDVTSNSSVIVQNTLLKVEYPYGFTYTSSNVGPIPNTSVWNIGDLKNGDKKTITISGVLVGQNMEDRSFRISVGTANGADPKTFDTDLAVNQATIGIRKSFYDLTLAMGGNSVVRVGGQSNITIQWQNTLPERLLNNSISVSLSGNALDRSVVNPTNGGFYQSVNNTVVWDKNSTPILSNISPGDNGSVSLNLGTISNPVVIRSIKNPHIDVHVEMEGSRSGQDITPVSSTQDVTIKMESTLSFTANSYKNNGGISNTGPVPPQADKESTYTVTWTLTNTTNDLSGTIVSGMLPPGVTWKGEATPASERISYNPDTKRITWNVGNVSAGSGFTLSPREVSFKVGITPSVSQVGTTPALVTNMSAGATDTYTNTTLTQNTENVTTRFNDSNFQQGNDTVVK
ncbi:MAG: hypothetical protein V4473_02800 [Patescibacteria group bacterium]